MSFDNRLVAVALVALLAGVGAGAWAWFRAPPGVPASAELTVKVSSSPLTIPGDPEGSVRVFLPGDVVELTALRCGERTSPAALWVASGANEAWTRVELPGWAEREGCLEARVAQAAATLWPGVAPGVGRWAWVIGPDAGRIVDPADPERAWRAGTGFAHGEVVLRAQP